jgi:hypothetical protein
MEILFPLSKGHIITIHQSVTTKGEKKEILPSRLLINAFMHKCIILTHASLECLGIDIFHKDLALKYDLVGLSKDSIIIKPS